MNTLELLNTSFEARKHLVYEILEVGYLIDNGEELSYSTFLQRRFQITSNLNLSAKMILLSIDAKKTLEELLESCFNIFEGVTREQFFVDFMDVINKLERQGIIMSTVEKERYCLQKEHQRNAFDANLKKMKQNYPYF